MRKRKETELMQEVITEAETVQKVVTALTEPDSPGKNSEVIQARGKNFDLKINLPEWNLPGWKKTLKTLPPGPEKEKVRELIRAYQKVLKENEKLQKQIAAREEKGKYRMGRFIINATRGDASSRLGQMEIDFENPLNNNALFNKGNSDAFIAEPDFNLRQKKIFDTICMLLYHRSKNVTDIKSRDFISGDGITENGYIQLMINEYDIAKAYCGKAPDGRLLKEVRTVLYEVSKRHREIIIPDRKNNYHGYSGPLWTFSYKANQDRKIIDSGISIHPIFRAAINYKYIEKPDDFLQRLDNASGKIRGTRSQSNETDYDLANLLMIQATISEYYEVNEIPLLEKIAKKEMDRRKKSDAKAKLFSAVEICQEMGIIESYEYTDNKSAGKKYIFKLNKNWYPVAK